MSKLFSKVMDFLFDHMEEIRISLAVICVLAFIVLFGWLFLNVATPKTSQTIQDKQRLQFLFSEVKGPSIRDTVQ